MTQRQLFVASGLGALRVVVSLVGATLPGMFGIPGLSGAINVLWVGGFLALACLVTGSPWAATVSAVVFSILALPLPLSGPPGFLPKILVGLASGLAADLVYRATRRHETLAPPLIGAAGQTALGVVFAGLGILFQVPAIDKYVALQFSPLGMISTVCLGGLSGFLGGVAYRAIKNSDLVRRARG
jgi:hypothetical protein